MKKIIMFIAIISIIAAFSVTGAAVDNIPHEVAFEKFTFRFDEDEPFVLKMIAPEGGIGEGSEPLIDGFGFENFGITGPGIVSDPTSHYYEIAISPTGMSRPVSEGGYISGMNMDIYTAGGEEFLRFQIEDEAVGTWTVKGFIEITHGFSEDYTEVIGEEINVDFQISNDFPVDDDDDDDDVGDDDNHPDNNNNSNRPESSETDDINPPAAAPLAVIPTLAAAVVIAAAVKKQKR